MKRKVTLGRILYLFALLVLATQGCSREEGDTGNADTLSRANTFTNFASEIVLEGYANTELRGHTFLVLTWRAFDDKPRDVYTVFVHAIDKEGKMLFQFDHELVNRVGKSTTFWDQAPVKDVFQLTPPAGYPPGKYTIRLGPYVKNTGRFLEVFATDLPRPTEEFWKARAVLLRDINCR